MYDLVISGGHILDPSQELDGPGDVAIAGGKVAEAGGKIDPSGALRHLDASGCYVTPGLIDFHAHGYWGVSHYGIDLDRYSLGRGVTTALDPGSAGAQTWPGFRHHVVEKASSRLFALLNVSLAGMISPLVGECEELRYLDPALAARTVGENRDLLVGIKVRLSRKLVGANRVEPLQRALEAAEMAGVLLMVHIGDTYSPLDEIMARLRPGDVVTHCFQGKQHQVIDDGGRVLRGVWKAVERGVRLDVGHGMNSFAFGVAERAMDQGLLPHTISSDIHAHSVPEPAGDLVTTMSKLMMLGMPLYEVVRRTTEAPAQTLGMTGRLGTLRPGAEGDVTLLKLEEGEFSYRDSAGEERRWNHRLEPVAVVKGGRELPIIGVNGEQRTVDSRRLMADG